MRPGGASLKAQRTRQGGRDGTNAASGSACGHTGAGGSLPATARSNNRDRTHESGAMIRRCGGGGSGGDDARSGRARRPHEEEGASLERSAAAASGLSQWHEEEGVGTDDGYRGIDARQGGDAPCDGRSDLQRSLLKPATERSFYTSLAPVPAPQGVRIRRWHFVVRVARASGLCALLPEIKDRSGMGRKSNSGGLGGHGGNGGLGDGLGWVYVHYRWEGGGVVAPLTGETAPVICGDGVSFGHERSLHVPTSLSKSEFGAFLQTQSVSFEVWRVPPGGQQANLFTHTLIGTATASLADAVAAGACGCAIECRVTPATGVLLRASTSEQGACGHAGTAGLRGTGYEGWGTGRDGSSARGGWVGGSCVAGGAAAAAAPTATLFVGLAIGTDDPISAPLELPSQYSRQPAEEWRGGAGTRSKGFEERERPESWQQSALPPLVSLQPALSSALPDSGAESPNRPSVIGGGRAACAAAAPASTATDALTSFLDRPLDRAADGDGRPPPFLYFGLDPAPPLSPSTWRKAARPQGAAHQRAGATGIMTGAAAASCSPWGDASSGSSGATRVASVISPWHEPLGKEASQCGSPVALWAGEAELDASRGASAGWLRDPARDAARDTSSDEFRDKCRDTSADESRDASIRAYRNSSWDAASWDASRNTSRDTYAAQQLKLSVARDVEYAQQVLASLGGHLLSDAAVGLSSHAAHDRLPLAARGASDADLSDIPHRLSGTREGVTASEDDEFRRFAPAVGRTSYTSLAAAPICSSGYSNLPFAASAAPEPPSARAAAAAAPRRRETVRLRVTSADLPASECEHAALGAAYRVRVVLPGAVCIDSVLALTEPAQPSRHRLDGTAGGTSVRADPSGEMRRWVAERESGDLGGERAEDEHGRGVWPAGGGDDFCSCSPAGPCALRVRVHLSHTFSVDASTGLAAASAELQLWRLGGAHLAATAGGVSAYRIGEQGLGSHLHARGSAEEVMVGCAFISLSSMCTQSEERLPLPGSAPGGLENCAGAAVDASGVRPLLVVRKVDGLTTDGSIHATVGPASGRAEGAWGEAAGAMPGGAMAGGLMGRGCAGVQKGAPMGSSLGAEADTWDERDRLALPPPALASTVGRWHRRDRSCAGQHSDGSTVSACPSADLSPIARGGEHSAGADAFGMGGHGAAAAPTLALSLASCLRDLDDISASLHDRLVRSGTGAGPSGTSASRNRTGPQSAPGGPQQHPSADSQRVMPAAPAHTDLSISRAAPSAPDETMEEDIAATEAPGEPPAHPATPWRRPTLDKAGGLRTVTSPRTSSAEKPLPSALSPQALRRIARILHSKPEPARSTESDSD
jgi:hypothetical protein